MAQGIKAPDTTDPPRSAVFEPVEQSRFSPHEIRRIIRRPGCSCSSVATC